MSEQSSAALIAAVFVAARREARALPDYPGALPATLDEAYAVQEAELRLSGSAPRGWKVAMVKPELRRVLGAERIAGPAFHVVEAAADAHVAMPVVAGGFAAFEAEFIAVMAKDLPPRTAPYTADEVKAAVGNLHVGVEIAGSPLASLNDLGPTAVVSDFGNNAGLVLGPAVPNWRERSWESMTSATTIDGAAVGQGSAANVPGSPLAAIAFLADHLGRCGRGLKAGELVSTGMTTGIHLVKPGVRAIVDFGDCGRLTVDIVAT
ncbi:2-keto-4-pentenoate hydratase [Chelatococcus sp. GCM10030263]|uniref:2-keto-4-pentenoate hydratase n=1 Tax=Chelatococcus sp. GCM10030263 TaxID=3273387 RepID=UPI003617B3A5